MKIQKKREIVIEFERVSLVRKRTRTRLIFCRSCGREVDFISLPAAVALFAAEPENLLRFVRLNDTHFETGADGAIFLCLVSLLAAVKACVDPARAGLLGD